MTKQLILHDAEGLAARPTPSGTLTQVNTDQKDPPSPIPASAFCPESEQWYVIELWEDEPVPCAEAPDGPY